MSFRQLKNSLPILLRMMARKLGVKFRIQGTSAFTTGDIVVVPYGDFNDPVYCRQVLGMTVHEGGHLMFTDFQVGAKAPTPDEQQADPAALARFTLLKWINNAIEDVRMECRVIDRYPGARQVLADCVESIKDDPEWFKEVTDEDSSLSALQAYILYRLRAEVLEQPLLNHAVQAERVVREKIGDDLTQAITEKMFEARTAQSTADSLRIATDILSLIDDEIQKEAERQQPPPPGAGGESDFQGDQGEQQPGDGQSTSQTDSSGNGQGSNAKSTPDQQQADGSDAQNPSSGNQGNGAGSSSGSGSADASQSQDSSGGSGGAQGGTARAQALQQLLSGEETGRIADLSEAFNKAVEKAAETYQTQSGDKGGGLYLNGQVEDAVETGDPSSLLDTIRLSTMRLSGQMQGLLEASAEDELENVTCGRLVDVRGLSRLYRGQTDVFLDEHESAQVDTAVVLLLDRSGSMQSLIGLAQKCVASAALAVEKVPDAKVVVAAFPGASANVIRLTKAGESVRRTLGRYSLHATGGTPTAEALWWAGAEIASLGATRNIVIVCTDGEPNDPEQAQRIIGTLRKAGVEVIGVGLGSAGTAAVKQLLRGVDACGVQSIDQLAPELFAVLRQKLAVSLAA